MSDVIGQTQAGPLEKIPNLKSRQRAIYYRPFKKPDGTVEWLETRLLPSDAQGRELYLSKGFRLKPPTDTTTPEVILEDEEKEALRAEVQELRNQIKMAKVREARGKKEET